MNRERETSSRPAIHSNAFRDYFDELSNGNTANLPNVEEGSSCALSSAIVEQILSQHQSSNSEEELAQLLEDDAVSIFMQSAKAYAQHIGVTEQKAVSEILMKVSRLKDLWKEILHRKGVEQLEKESHS